MGDLSGNIIRRSAQQCRQHADMTTHATRHSMRAQVTHVALICNDPTVQPLLPQVVIGDSSTLTVGLQRELEECSPENVHVWRLGSHWVDVAVLQSIIRATAAVVRALSPPRRCVLLMDCCPVHLKTEVLQTIRACGVSLILVPAKFTWLLQPLDTHVFNAYKRSLRKQWSRMRMESQEGIINMRQWWLNLATHVHNFMVSQSWEATFEQTGWTHGGNRTSVTCEGSSNGPASRN